MKLLSPSKIKEHPIIFSGPNIQKIQLLEKTQTRRVVTPQPDRRGTIGDFGGEPAWYWPVKRHSELEPDYYHTNEDAILRAMERHSAIKVGDRLRVKHPVRVTGRSASGFRICDEGIQKPADRFFYWHEFPHKVPKEGKYFGRGYPRELSLIFLEVVDVRYQRLRQISEADAIAEGADGSCLSADGFTRDIGLPVRAQFNQTWDAINASRPGCAWMDNPFVRAISFSLISSESSSSLGLKGGVKS